MTHPYTPTTAEIRERCIDYDEMRAEVIDQQEAEFDRWLRKHDEEVWEHGAANYYSDNPYRQEGTGE